MTRFVYGYELTWHVHRPNMILWRRVLGEHCVESWSNNVDLGKSFHRALADRTGLDLGDVPVHDNAHAHELEIGSPPSRDDDFLRAYWHDATRLARQLNLRTHGPRGGHMSGGGHLHVSPASGPWSGDFVAEFLRDFCNRPYLNWVFNDSEDDENASNPMTRDGDVGHIWDVDYRYDRPWKMTGLEFGKGFGAQWRSDYGTIELRFFDAPRDWSEQKLHLDFADAWLSHHLDRFRRGRRTRLRYRWPCDVQEITFTQAAREFCAMLLDLGLRPRDYAPLVERNMRRRYRDGLNRD